MQISRSDSDLSGRVKFMEISRSYIKNSGNFDSNGLGRDLSL